ncbi:Leucine-rich repeat [Macleaya cordata]|uniref:Leucine-rich repeat n=1 Tax=Macleaya cordata TaxID=56857 RepID=A0A200PPP3_MACCD|nr:Leucine-rich repeat [Macleaya cordata]
MFFGSDLRRLRLVDCARVSDDGLIEIAPRLYLLEELQLCHCKLSTEVVQAFGDGCPQLESFRLNYPRGSGFDEYALPIAKSMPQLRHLHLFGNKLTKDGLRTILDGCTRLESLDLRQCSYLFLDADLLKRCADAGIKKLRLPKDSIDDYEYDVESLDDEEDDDGSDDDFSDDSDLQSSDEE